MVGLFSVIYGIAAIANSHVFVGDLRAWGLVTLILAVLQLLAAAGILAGNQLARWFGRDVGAVRLRHAQKLPIRWTPTIPRRVR
jgi:hypothetical protein